MNDDSSYDSNSYASNKYIAPAPLRTGPWYQPAAAARASELKGVSGSCRCAIVGVPWRLRRLSLFGTFSSTSLADKSPQARHLEADPRHGTPAMAHF